MAKSNTKAKAEVATQTAGQQTLDLEFKKELFSTNVKKAMAELGGSKRDYYVLPVASFTILEQFNVRVQNAKWHARVRSIANSIKREGFKQDKPISVITVTKDGVTYIHPYDGHTRLAALELANSELVKEGKDPIEQVPAKPAPMGTTLEDLTTNLVTGNMGAPLEPFEIGVVCKRKLGYGNTVEQIAADLDLTEGWVNDLLLLMGSPKALRDMVQNDHVAATEAIAALKKHQDKALEVLERALAKAQAGGSNRVTGKHMPGHALNRALKTNAPAMVDAITNVKNDPAYKSLAQETQKQLEDLLAAINAAKEEEKAAEPQQDLVDQQNTVAEAA